MLRYIFTASNLSTSPLEGKRAQQLVHIHPATESKEPEQVKILTETATHLCMTLFHLGNPETAKDGCIRQKTSDEQTRFSNPAR
jgi:hypothetical protein